MSRNTIHTCCVPQTSVGPSVCDTQFRTWVTTRGRFREMAYEITADERPGRLVVRTIKATITVQSIETFDPVPSLL